MNGSEDSSRGWFWIATRPLIDVALAFLVVSFLSAIVSGFSAISELKSVFQVFYWGDSASRKLIVSWLAVDAFIVILFACGLAFLRRSVRRAVSLVIFGLLLINHYHLFPPANFSQAFGVGMFRFLGWLDPLVRAGPYLIFTLVGCVALVSLLVVEVQRNSSSSWNWMLLGVSPRRSKRLAFMSCMLVLTVNLLAAVSYWDQLEAPKDHSEEILSAKTIVLVTHEVLASDVRTLLTDVSRESDWMRTADRLIVHKPALQIQKSMSWELIEGKAIGGPRSNWDVRWSDAVSAQRVLSFRNPFDQHWIWENTIPIQLQGDEFIRRTRSALNPIFTALVSQLSEQQEGSPFVYEDSFTFLLKKLRTSEVFKSFHDFDVMFIELPPFPGNALDEKRDLYWEQLRIFVQKLRALERFPNLERLAWVGLPKERALSDEFSTDEAALSVYLGTSAALEWRIHPSAQSYPREEGLGDQNREIWLENLLPIRPAFPTHCLRNMIWDLQAPESELPGRCEASLARQTQLTVFESDAQRLIQASSLQNYLNLVRPHLGLGFLRNAGVFIFSKPVDKDSKSEVRKLTGSPSDLERMLLARAGYEWRQLGSAEGLFEAPSREILE